LAHLITDRTRTQVDKQMVDPVTEIHRILDVAKEDQYNHIEHHFRTYLNPMHYQAAPYQYGRQHHQAYPYGGVRGSMYHPGSLSPHRILRAEKNALQKRKIHAPVYTSDPYLPYHPAAALTEPEGFYNLNRDLD